MLTPDKHPNNREWKKRRGGKKQTVPIVQKMGLIFHTAFSSLKKNKKGRYKQWFVPSPWRHTRGDEVKAQWSVPSEVICRHSSGLCSGSPVNNKPKAVLLCLNWALPTQALNESRWVFVLGYIYKLCPALAVSSLISITNARKHGLRCVATSSRTDSEVSQQVSLL